MQERASCGLIPKLPVEHARQVDLEALAQLSGAVALPFGCHRVILVLVQLSRALRVAVARSIGVRLGAADLGVVRVLVAWAGSLALRDAAAPGASSRGERVMFQGI